MCFEVCPEITNEKIEAYRRRYLGYLMADGGALVPSINSSTNLPKQHLNRFQLIYINIKYYTILVLFNICFL